MDLIIHLSPVKSIIIIGLTIISIIYSLSNASIEFSREPEKVCYTDDCWRSTFHLSNSMDESVNPCEDFYKFVCGKWGEEHKNPGWFIGFNNFNSMTEMLLKTNSKFLNANSSADDATPVIQSRDFYKSCLDNDSRDALGYSVIYKYLQKVGLPLVPNFFKDVTVRPKFNWIKVAVNLKTIFSLDVFFKFTVVPNVFNESSNILVVEPGNLESLLPKTPFGLEFSKNIKLILKDLIQNAGNTPDESKLNEVYDLIDSVRKNIRANSWIHFDFTLFDLKKLKFHELQKITDDYLISNNLPKLRIWKPYITFLFKASDKIKFNFKEDYIYVSEYYITSICKIAHLIALTPKHTLELYTWWAVVESMIMSTTSHVLRMLDNVEEHDPPIDLKCSRIVYEHMPYAVSHGILEKNDFRITKLKLEEMLNDIKNAFVYEINNIEWMDKKNKNITIEKSNKMLSFIGFPEWIQNKTAVELYYSNISINSSTYLENLMQFVQLVTPTNLNNFKKENTGSWQKYENLITPVNAFNSFRENAIVIPGSILAFPVYNLGLEALNYGALGTILGHEITHGFDTTGTRFDKQGNFIPLWTNDTLENFEEKIECFVSQYNNFLIETLEEVVDGSMTLDENLADNGGLHHAYLAYQYYLKRHGEELRLPEYFENYTSNQLFFMGFANNFCEIENEEKLKIELMDSHSPNYIRILGTLQNSNEFAEAFKCPVGTRMNPNRTRCRIW